MSKDANNDLWEALVALAAGAKTPAKTKAKGPTPKPSAPTPIAPSKWRETEAILIIHEAECQVCQAVYTWPNPYLLIKKEHPRLGTHYVQAPPDPRDPELVYAYLPRRTEYQLSNVQQCPRCFNIAAAITHGREASKEEKIA